MAKKKVENQEQVILEDAEKDEELLEENLETKIEEKENSEEVIKTENPKTVKKPLSKKLKLVIKHIGFVLGVILVTIVGCAIYYNGASKDLSNYYVVGSYRIISLKKVCPDCDCELIGISTTENKSNIEAKSKHYEQTVVYNFGINSKSARDEVKREYTNKLMDLNYQYIALADGYIQDSVMINVNSLDDADGFKIKIVISYDK